MTDRRMGMWYEELPVGTKVEHAITRTLTETDNVLFTTMSMNPQPLHLDAEFAASTQFGRPLVNSLFTLALAVGISVPELTLGTTVANLGFSGASWRLRRRLSAPAREALDVARVKTRVSRAASRQTR